MRNGLEEVQSIGAAKVGDKTLIDAFAPALEAFSAATAKGESFAAALDALIVAAEKGRDSTIDLVAKIGRASRLGERSRGVLDPGATSCAIILRTFAEGAKAKLDASNPRTSQRGAAMKIALGADSVGKPLLDVIAAHLAQRPGLTVADLSGPRFYAEVAEKVGRAVLAGEYDRGILFCGTGIGVSHLRQQGAGHSRRLDPRRLFGRAGGEIQQCSDHHHGVAGHRPRTGQDHRRRLARAAAFDPAGPSAANVAAIDRLDARTRAG